MSLSAGTRLGPYDIVAPLGAGGMGEVYRATDTRLKRQVAVKILPPALAADPDRLARFQREAEVLASLNHEHIASIYGLEEADEAKALVMELVEGPTLADRIAQGPIPADEAVPIASQIAQALEAAHEQGIIHRDLKPANIKVRDDGRVKVLDFGLAKLAEAPAASRVGLADPSQSPTLTGVAAMTGVGMILGTAAYMSPEQARGRAVDKRTDVWAFGAVLYEMLTGRRAFDGEDVTEMMAAVMKSTPDWTALPADVPPNVATLIQRCLEKDRNARIGDIAVARFLLSGHGRSVTLPAASAHVSSAAAPLGRQAMPRMLAALAVVALGGIALGWFLPRRSVVTTPVTHLQMNLLPADQFVRSIGSPRPARTALAISPDGRRVVFAALRGLAAQLYLRELDQFEAAPIGGTEGAIAPFFSPDGAWIGFLADNKIKKVPVGGGPATTIADLPAGPSWGATWGEEDTIFLASNAGISRVSSASGTPATMTMPERGEQHGLPHALPGGKAVLFTVVTSRDWSKANVVLVSLDTGEQRVLVQGGADARYVSSGHLIYMKTGTLMAVPFDLRSLQVTGAEVPLIEGVMQSVNAPNGGDETGAGQLAISSSGTLIYLGGGISPNLETAWVWVDRAGTVQGTPTVAAGSYLFPRLSPDGSKVAVNVRTGANRSSDVWVYDVLRGAPIRLTFDANGSWPIWSPDGKRVAYAASANYVGNLHIINADGGGTAERLASSEFAQTPSSWASSPNVIAFLQRPQRETYGIWVLPMDGDRTPKLFLESRFMLTHAELSPDGRWMAYASTESGNAEVYVQPYPGPGEKVRISTSFGTEPIWAPSGRELLYRSGTQESQQFFSVAIRSVSPFRADPPRLLFEAKAGSYDSTVPNRSWSVSADGQRFLLQRYESTEQPITTMHVVLNWADELQRRARP